MIFGTAAWQIAEAHTKLAPTYVYRYDFAPRTLHWAGLGATHATELLAVFGIYRSRGRCGADRRGGPACRGQSQPPGADPLAGIRRTGVPGDWPVYHRDERPVLVFDRHTHVEFDPHPHRRQGLGRVQPGPRLSDDYADSLHPWSRSKFEWSPQIPEHREVPDVQRASRQPFTSAVAAIR